MTGLFITVVDYASGFAFAALNGLRRNEFHFYAQTDGSGDSVGQSLLQRFKFADTVREEFTGNFHIHFDIIHTVFGIKNDIVVRQSSIYREQGGFYLGREYIYAADDEHIVRTA